MANAFLSEKESLRFGQRIIRLRQSFVNAEEVASEMERLKADLLILRVPAPEIVNLHKLHQLAYHILVADTLVYYSTQLNGTQPLALQNPLAMRPATLADTADITQLIKRIFLTYTNHYTSNPNLPRLDVIEGYVEWALGHVTQPGHILFISEFNQEAVAFAACSYDENGRDCEGVLFGVDSSVQGRGIYTDLIRYTKYHFANLKYQRMLVSTQVQNFAVQKSWVKEHFKIDNAFYTIHVSRKPYTGK